ncbi:hypothetical protein NQ063_25505, partial [Escherichia coli]|nr:hypothetical protein [Escherichia coli]
SVKTGNNARNGGKNSLNRLIRCVCGKKIGPDPRNFNQRVSLGRNDLLIRTFLNITPHVGRHTWANITLEFIYNSLLSESLILAQDYGIRARMNGVLEPAIEQLRALGGWSLTSKVPLRYAKRFIEVVSNQSNYKRTKHSDMHLASPETNISQRKTSNLLEDNVYDEDFTFKDLFN